MPLPMIVAIRFGSSSPILRPESAMASSAAMTAIWVNRSMRATSMPNGDASKLLTSATTGLKVSPRSSRVHSAVQSPMPPVPFLSDCQ